MIVTPAVVGHVDQGGGGTAVTAQCVAHLLGDVQELRLAVGPQARSPAPGTIWGRHGHPPRQLDAYQEEADEFIAALDEGTTSTSPG